MLTPEQLQLYYRRIGYQNASGPDHATLTDLHHLHPERIPFENLDSWLGIPPAIETEAVFNKLVIQKRGGYCYEHNWLFMQVLKTIGYQVSGLAARVLWMQPEGFIAPRTHMALLAVVDGNDWLCDVGFGGQTMTAPLSLHSTAPQQTPNETLCLQKKENEYLLQTSMPDGWRSMYSFTTEIQHLPDYQQANWFVSTHPESRFVRNLVAARVEGRTRHALVNNRYTRHTLHEASHSVELQSPDEIRQILSGTFGIDTSTLQLDDDRLKSLLGST